MSKEPLIVPEEKGLTQKELANKLKQHFGFNYSIQGWNIYCKQMSGGPLDIMAVYSLVSQAVRELGYKRITLIDKGHRFLIGSVPFGICITIDKKKEEQNHE